MAFFGTALSSLRDIVAAGAGEHSDLLHSAIGEAETHPEQLADVIGRLSNHPDIGTRVQEWMANPQARALLTSLDGKSDSAPSPAVPDGSPSVGD